jgi:hypothetical protein
MRSLLLLLTLAPPAVAESKPKAPSLPWHLRSHKIPDGYKAVASDQLMKLKSIKFDDATNGRGWLMNIDQTNGIGSTWEVSGGYSFKGTWEVHADNGQGKKLDGQFSVTYLDRGADTNPRVRVMVTNDKGDWFIYYPAQKDPAKYLARVSSYELK